MRQKNKIVYFQWFWLVIAWICITNFFTWLISVNINLFFDLSDSWHVIKNNLFFTYMHSGLQYLEASLFGVFFGTAFFLINMITNRNKLVRKSFGKIILIKSTLYIAAIIASFFIIYGIFLIFDLFPNDAPLSEYGEFISFEYWTVVIFYYIFFILMTNIFLQITRKFGPGNFFRLLSGKYYEPREEKKIFLFIDLKSSTTIAENLGHKKYSQLLRDCFHDITDIVINYSAEVYQYVGDEIVLCWDLKKGLANLNCLETLFAYRKKLESKKDYYINEYGFLPEFKGGMDLGEVTVTEIGDIKRDIAYHGDVLNTAARIQEQCNSFDKILLFSEHLFDIINDKNSFKLEKMGELPLRGKKEELKIYSASIY